MRKNKSNKKIIKYKTFKFTNKSIRKFAPNPTKPLHSFGLIGKIFSCFLNFFLKPIIQILAFSLSGLFYSKGKDTPYKGSILYTIFYFMVIFFIIGFTILLINIAL